MKVLLIEKHQYPKHKVCGEYVSNEVLPYIQALGFDPFTYGATDISRLTISTKNSRSITVKLPRGGFGISRYCFDAELARLAQEKGLNILHATVEEVYYSNEVFTVTTHQNNIFHSHLLIGAFGKRSNLDRQMDRHFMKKAAPNLAVKAHYTGIYPDDLVGLHNFEGGYCGISKVENGQINVCYITALDTFKKYKNIEEFEVAVLRNNTFLKNAFDHMDRVFAQPLTISNISFYPKKPVENHVLMCGDSAGMIHPLAGNGMSMAIRSAQMLSHLIMQYSVGKIPDRMDLEKKYIAQWNHEFRRRLTWGRRIARIFDSGLLSGIAFRVLKLAPGVLQGIIRKTHGNPMELPR